MSHTEENEVLASILWKEWIDLCFSLTDVNAIIKALKQSEF